MARAKYYSPRLERDLISRLYHQAKADRVPMTALASRLVRESPAGREHEITSVIAEEPPPMIPAVGTNQRITT